ncbi:IclR family transcriptional regulator [Chelatococcus reniformis]|uniref:IclR family transcriptional regulator n=1 Tax=Chelatococcus reniformis TaxID=1494448 RepID=A0A916UH88_9HYPH|nr:IclR family transcriptional regulator [Chelatococcus reniformis]GGC72293.1 IclR family transcriptional regulator [Chelatococcus reniformis]
MGSTETAGAPQGAQLIARAAEILRAIPRGAVEGRRLRDLALSAGLTEPTTHRILKALVHEQFVVQDPVTRLYRLGALAFELGLAAGSHAQLVESCRPRLRQLALETGDSVFLAMRTGIETVCLDRADGGYPIRAAVWEVGSRLMLGIGTGGVALLAAMRPHEAEEILGSAAYAATPIPVAELRARVAQARRDGFADISDKPIPGVRGIGVAVPTRAGAPVLSLSVVAVHARLTDDHLAAILPHLHAAARRTGAITATSS